MSDDVCSQFGLPKTRGAKRQTGTFKTQSDICAYVWKWLIKNIIPNSDNDVVPVLIWPAKKSVLRQTKFFVAFLAPATKKSFNCRLAFSCHPFHCAIKSFFRSVWVFPSHRRLTFRLSSDHAIRNREEKRKRKGFLLFQLFGRFSSSLPIPVPVMYSHRRNISCVRFGALDNKSQISKCSHSQA